jgi:hypothetical protein
MKLLTQKQYAERRGCRPQYINKLVRGGRIELHDGKINPREADAALASMKRVGRVVPAKRATQKPAKAKKSAAKKQQRRHSPGRPVSQPPAAAALEQANDPKPGSATARLTQSRARGEHYKAELARIEFERMSRILIPADEVLKAEQQKNANVRTRFRRLARSVAPLLARLTQPAEIELTLGEEIDRLLRELAADPLGMQPEPEPPAPSPAIDTETTPEVAAEVVQTTAGPETEAVA